MPFAIATKYSPNAETAGASGNRPAHLARMIARAHLAKADGERANVLQDAQTPVTMRRGSALMPRTTPPSKSTNAPKKPDTNITTPPDGDLLDAIQRYVHAYVQRHGVSGAWKTLSVSRHTLCRLLEREQASLAVPKAVVATVGDSVEALDAASTQVIAAASAAIPAKPAPIPDLLPKSQHDAQQSLCATPLATAAEMARFTRVPATPLRDRLAKLAAKGLADSVSHRLDSVGPQPQHRFFPTAAGIETAARPGPEH